jgi:cystathionine beta-lyase
MAKALDFSAPIDRKNSNCVKYGLLKERFKKDDILPLWVADTDFSAPKSVVKALKKRVSHPIYGYSIYPKSYFKAIKKQMQSYAFSVKTKQIVTVPSVVSAINIALQTFCKKGEGVIVQTPIYPPFLSSVKNNSLELLQNTLVKDKDFAIDFEDFETKAKRAKAFIFCNPHNPCGRVFDKETVAKLAAICVRNDVLIISDEVHADIVYENREHTPIALFAPKHTLTLNAPSKTYSLTGLSSAYAIVQNETLKRKFTYALSKLGFHTANPFSIEATVVALKQKRYKKQLVGYLQENLDYLMREINKIEKIDAIKPQGTFLLWLDCTKLGLDDAELKEYFVNELGLGLNSGIDFGEAGSGYMRLNFATTRKNLKKAVQALKKI